MPGEFIWTGVAVLMALLAIATWLGVRETRIRKALMEDSRSASGADLAYEWPLEKLVTARAVYLQKLMGTREHEEELRLKYQLHRVSKALEYREQVRDGGIIQDEEGRQKP